MKAVKIKLWERKGGIISSASEGMSAREAQELASAAEEGYRIVLFVEKRVNASDPHFTLRVVPKTPKPESI